MADDYTDPLVSIAAKIIGATSAKAPEWGHHETRARALAAVFGVMDPTMEQVIAVMAAVRAGRSDTNQGATAVAVRRVLEDGS